MKNNWLGKLGAGLMTVGAMFAAAFMTGCAEKVSDSGVSEETGIMAVTNKTIAGVSQKGPMKTGSTVVLKETKGSNLVQTDRLFVGTVHNNKGEFRIDGVSLISPYVLLSAEGYYTHDVEEYSGVASHVTLNAVANVEKRDEVNLNVLTHFTYGRILGLAKKGYDFESAKKQAEKEIARSFGFDDLQESPEDLNIFSGSHGDNRLLALSVIVDFVNAFYFGSLSQYLWLEKFHPELQYCTGNRDCRDDEGNRISINEGNATQMILDDIADEFAAEGKLSPSMMDVLAVSATSYLGTCIQVKIKDSVEVRKEKAFEKYISSFIGFAYGIGDCDAEKDGVMYERNQASESRKIFSCETNQYAIENGYASVLACKNGYWIYKAFRCDTNDFLENDEDYYAAE